MLLLVLGPMLM